MIGVVCLVLIILVLIFTGFLACIPFIEAFPTSNGRRKSRIVLKCLIPIILILTVWSITAAITHGPEIIVEQKEIDKQYLSEDIIRRIRPYHEDEIEKTYRVKTYTPSSLNISFHRKSDENGYIIYFKDGSMKHFIVSN